MYRRLRNIVVALSIIWPSLAIAAGGVKLTDLPLQTTPYLGSSLLYCQPSLQARACTFTSLFAGPPPIGSVTPNSGVFTTIQGTIGNITPAPGTFTTLTASTPVPISSGGNGTSTPIITQGGSVTISGTWPNYTINAIGISRPQGRLTLATATPVMTSSVAGATSVFYTPYAGNQVPLPSGGVYYMSVFAEVSQATTDTTKSPAAVAASSCYDDFVWNDAGTIRATRGPVWTNCTTRSAGSALVLTNGLLVNSSAITNGPGAGLGVWVGAIASNASSTIDYIFGGGASGGVAGVLNVCNQYNRVSTSTFVTDNGAAYTYSIATVRQARASAGNQITFLLCSTEEQIYASYITECFTAATVNTGCLAGVGLDSTTTFAFIRASFLTATAAGQQATLNSSGPIAAGFGQHFISANEYSAGAVANTFNGVLLQRLSLTIRN